MTRTVNLAATALILAAVVIGCASTGQRAPRGKPDWADPAATAVPAETVEVGMSKTDVRRLWGTPRDVSAKQGTPDTEIWTYEFKKAMAGVQGGGSARAVVQRVIYTLTFEGDRLTQIAEKSF